MTVNTECARLSTEADPPTRSSDPDSRQGTEVTWVESPTVNGQGHTSAEPEASSATEPQGLEKGRQKDLIWVEETTRERDESIQDTRQNRWPGAQGGNYGPPTSMVAIEHSTAANSSGQAILEADLGDGAGISQRSSVVANRESSENILSRKVVNMPPLTLEAC
jgi:hypothetical protein